jgi:hypothetical protein
MAVLLFFEHLGILLSMCTRAFLLYWEVLRWVCVRALQLFLSVFEHSRDKAGELRAKADVTQREYQPPSSKKCFQV